MGLSGTSKSFLLIAINNMGSQIKRITSQTKLHLYCKHGFWLHTEESFVCIFTCLDNISILLDDDNDLEDENYSFT